MSEFQDAPFTPIAITQHLLWELRMSGPLSPVDFDNVTTVHMILPRELRVLAARSDALDCINGLFDLDRTASWIVDPFRLARSFVPERLNRRRNEPRWDLVPVNGPHNKARRLAIDAIFGERHANIGRIKELVLAEGDIDGPISKEMERLELLELQGLDVITFFGRSQQDYWPRLKTLLCGVEPVTPGQIPAATLQHITELEMTITADTPLDSILAQATSLEKLSLHVKGSLPTDAKNVLKITHPTLTTLSVKFLEDRNGGGLSASHIVRLETPSLADFEFDSFASFEFAPGSDRNLVCLKVSMLSPSEFDAVFALDRFPALEYLDAPMTHMYKTRLWKQLNDHQRWGPRMTPNLSKIITYIDVPGPIVDSYHGMNTGPWQTDFLVGRRLRYEVTARHEQTPPKSAVSSDTDERSTFSGTSRAPSELRPLSVSI